MVAEQKIHVSSLLNFELIWSSKTSKLCVKENMNLQFTIGFQGHEFETIFSHDVDEIWIVWCWK